MRKRRWIATLVALGLVGTAGTSVHAQTVGRPAVDAGPGLFPYNLPPAPLPAGTTVSVAPPAGPALPATPVGQPMPVPQAVPATPVMRPASPARTSTFADMTVPVITPAQGATVPSATVGAPMTIPPTVPMPGSFPMPGTAVPATPMPGTIVPAPSAGMFGSSTAGSGTGVSDPKPAAEAINPTLTATWNNGLYFGTSDKDWIIHIGGRLQFEPVFWSQPTSLKASAPGNGGVPAATAKDGAGVGALDDGMFFRRVRLRSDGVGYGTVEYALEVDFEQLNFITWDHMWAGFKDVPFLGTVRVGQHKVPQGMESMSSDYHLTFLERSSVTDAFWTIFAPGIFVANDYFDKSVTAQTMFHRIQPLGFYNEDFGDGNYASTSRVTYTPIYADNGEIVLHVGGSYQWRKADLGRTIQPGGTGNTYADTQGDVRFRARPELRDATGIGSIGNGVLGGDTGRFVDTGFLLASSVSTASPEFLLIYGPFSVQAEGAFATVQNARSIYPTSAAGKDRGNPMFWGSYIQASYFLTGEHRGYDRRFGTFDRPKVANNFNPKNCGDGDESCDNGTGLGAWEIGYRFSYLDLNDKGITGGIMRQNTIGLNWYFNDNFKVQFNYVNINRGVVQPAVSGTTHGLGMLAQWYF